MQRKTNGAKDSLRISLALFIYNIGNRAELCAIACFKKQRAERSCVFQNEKLFYNIGNCAESCAIACFKKQRAKRGCVFQNEKLFYKHMRKQFVLDICDSIYHATMTAFWKPLLRMLDKSETKN